MLMQLVRQMSEQMRVAQTNQQTFQQSLQARLDDEREAVQTQIRALQSTIATPLYTPQPPATSSAETIPLEPGRDNQVEHYDEPTRPWRKTRPTLQDPPRYEGARAKFRAWLSEMRNKLRVDGTVIGSKADQFAYVYSRLGGAPQQMTIAFVEAGGKGGAYDPDDYLRYLEECYADPNLQARAIERLRSLRQRESESFAALLPRFEKELADSGGASWPDEVKISYLEGATNQQLRLAAVYQAPARTSYTAWAQALQTLASGLDGLSRREQGRDGRDPRGPSGKAATPEPRRFTLDADGDTKMAGVNRAGQPSGVHPDTEHDRKNPRDERRCYRCNQKGHLIANCRAKVILPEKERPKVARIEDAEVAGDVPFAVRLILCLPRSSPRLGA
ncbi:ectomycorrhiza-upregulated zf-MYND domain-containing protein [Purpureocillium lavendulum]|uniref:Ectomycorrhiza-upregulated zf-MYND domain-containing protein n=1 Tax=Purpureocillium lavendulum TaxID=1247861 RepID=A0AB34FC46_9HYPO|nr:ectomycorrhiza-upregulated zf-MYND domain-containing protein [Purpureocillium lavendulum]